ncbi:sigma-70 family RNA polymerase sigma factor [Nocardiopsis prasina]|uniref:sigma-70 family RNA polymerase sigma factor n=1 Tax=Nocardiopsis prasina TaxID=2015 RepID=UPI0003467FBB|nr:sigma-70 family RNA polymerase sigma factor [Nocardiopsis prasina]
MTRGNETGVPTTDAVEGLHDAFAQPLFRYAWSLLGDPDQYSEGADRPDEDPVTDAVHEALVAGVELGTRLADPADRGPWLFALVRAACQRRGFAHTCPYTRLATVPAEAPVARMFSRLPASHRELVELNLRHALSTSAVSRVLGLEPRICGELSRSAIRRAAEGLEDLPAPEPDEDTPSGNWRTQVHQVSSALALLRPPGAPPGLRDRVVHTCTSPDAAEERARITAAMQPLTADGYPVHRSRPPGDPVVEATEDGGPVEVPLPRALPRDLVMTADHPVRDDARSPLPSPDHDPHGEITEAGRRRWPLPAISGLATVVVALGLWWWASSVGGPTTMIDSGPALPGQRPGLSEVEAVSTASDGKPGTEPTSATAAGDASTEAPGTDTPKSDGPSGSPDGPQDEGDGEGQPREGHGGEGPESPGEAPGAPEPPEEQPDPGQGEDDEEPPGNGGGAPGNSSPGLLGDLLGLLFGNGQSEAGEPAE